MITKEDRKIIEDEIARLERAYRDAQDRYAYSGSASTDRTMHKYQTLQIALENYLTGNADESKDRMISRQWDQLHRLEQAIDRRCRSGDLNNATYLELTRIIRDV